MDVFGQTDIGRTRVTNQDSYAFGKFDDGTVWAVVCDGMGGANGGSVASSLAVKAVSDSILKSYSPQAGEASLRLMLEAALMTANTKIYEQSGLNEQLQGMGTTAVAVFVKDDSVFIMHVGDSRAYIASSNSIEQITRDHSVVQSMIENGELTPENAKKHPNKNMITRALGVGISVIPEYNAVENIGSSKVVICTDGLTNCVDNDTILSIVNSTDNDKIPQALIDAANNNGGRDNITVVVIA